MSQDYFSGKGKEPVGPRDAPANASNSSNEDQSSPREQIPSQPGYMTVGTGSTSEHAARLQAMLEKDSGYGGSSTGGDDVWDPAMHPDTHIPAVNSSSEAERRAQAGAIHQLWYNQHRGALGRSISRVIELLKGLQETNTTWPAHYPSVQRSDGQSSSRPPSRPGFSQAYSAFGDLPPPESSSVSAQPPPTLRRAMTSFEDSAVAESSRSAESKPAAEPRLVTPQIAQEFSILKLDLKLGALHQAELVHSLEKGSIASLLDGKISSSIKHLQALRDRIEDTSSKVLITGDLNAGKSTFCNALLRRKILPEDQQPCTAIFCEVLDARENGGVEEVHAVHKDAVYKRHDETTYDVYSLKDLEEIVTDNTKYMQCKVYVKDARTIDESLLNNGVVDIALIDAPGLNSDTTKTTAVFARQEEIDVVVFVVSAANHFTMTAKEFIWAVAAEKAYLFIVVNGFDAIKNKDKCRKMVLDQVSGLSPRTHKESSELVHFVSSNAIPVAPHPPGGPSGSGGGSGSSSGGGGGGEGGDDPSDDPKGKGKADPEKLNHFQTLEQSLRRFVLEKRARSKLAPARTYLLNILNDVNSLATVNSEVAQSEIDRVKQELDEIEPQLESSKKAVSDTADKVERIIDETADEVYNHTRTTLDNSISHAADFTHNVPYPGIFGAFEFADTVKAAMLNHMADSVQTCENYARSRAVSGVNVIKQLGILHVGRDKYESLTFRPEVMFSKRRDAIARQVDVSTEIWDFVDIATLVQFQSQEKVGAGMALTVATAVGSRMIGFNTWMDHALGALRLVSNDNLRRLIIPGIIVAALATTAYVVNQIPNSLPRRLSEKISHQLSAIDYVHANSTRISGSVRKVLRFPADNLRVTLDRSVQELGTRRQDTLKVRGESEVALKYFSNLVRDSAHQRAVVEGIDLDSTPPGAAEFHS